MICLNCDKEYESKIKTSKSRYCSRKCKNQYRKKTYRVSKIYICKHCGIEFNPKGYDRTTYCSRECAFADKKAKPKEKILPVCIVCGKKFEGLKNYKYCSDICYKIYSHNRYSEYKITNNYQNDLKRKKEKYAKENDIEIIEIRCSECGKLFKASNKDMRKYCSCQCLDKASRRNHHHKRRMMLKEQYVKGISFNEIYLRDKGICQICNKKVNLKHKSPHPMSASIDHIIPLSLGGTHEPKNVQLAHMICNSLKGNGTTEHGEQLRLC